MSGGMVGETVWAVFGLLVIVGACELFTNGIEWFGRKCNLSQGVVGSVLAAVGTALPETIVPIVAIFFSTGESAHDVGKGGILGAPFMLATLAFFVTGLSVVIFAKRRPSGLRMGGNIRVLRRDVGAFVLVYSVAVVAAFIDSLAIKIGIGVGLVLAYAVYVGLHFKDEEGDHDDECRDLKCLYFCWWNPEDMPRLRFTILQCLVALAAIFLGAHLFVDKLQVVCDAASMDTRLVALIVVPIATELPEKFNSVLWVRDGKDTLAIGNITGAMVFQSCIPVTVGVIWTDWQLGFNDIASAVIALTSGAILYLSLVITKKLSPWVLICSVFGYGLFLTLAL